MEHRFLKYLSPERVGTGQAVGDAEDLVESQQRAEIIGKTIAAAWAQIVETPDALLVDLISETTERICGFKPEPELVEQFLAGRSQLPFGAPPSVEEPPRRRPPTPAPVGSAPVTTIRQPQQIDGKNSHPVSFVLLDNRLGTNSWNDVLIQLCGLTNQLHPQEFDRVLKMRRSQRSGAKWPHHFSRSPADLRKPKSIRNSDIFAEVDLTATMMVDLCYRLVQLFGYRQDSLTIEFQ